MKKIGMAAFLTVLFSCQQNAQQQKPAPIQNQTPMATENLHQFKVEDIDGNTFDLADLKGKKVLQMAIDPDYTTVMKQPDSIISALSFLGGLLTIINISFLIKWLNYCNLDRRVKRIVYNMSILNDGGNTTDKLNLT
jgi:hypothetical protein